MNEIRFKPIELSRWRQKIASSAFTASNLHRGRERTCSASKCGQADNIKSCRGLMMLLLLSASFLVAFLLGLSFMLAVQPAQGQPTKNGRGLSFFIYRGPHKRCIHLHHWLLCLPLAGLLVLAAMTSGGQATCGLLFIIGLLVGVAASDVVFTDAAQLLEPCPWTQSAETEAARSPPPWQSRYGTSGARGDL